jgi:two-component system invasion response regulator UvrY
MMESKKEKIRVALVDDHILMRNALALVINNFVECKVVSQSGNGKEIITTVLEGNIPDVMLLDLNMPLMDGFETADWFQKHFPQVHILMLTMYDVELSLIRLLQAGVKGFLKKDILPAELRFAIQSVAESGFYYSNYTTCKLVNLFRNNNDGNMRLDKTILSSQEISFLKFASSDLTYKEIAHRMNLNPRSVDSLRDHLFMKLDVKSRVGLAMIAIRQGIVAF